MAQHATLIVNEPGHKVVRVQISEGITSIGRADGNSVRLRHDRNVSRHHAQITQREDGYWLSDLTTRNGTAVNDNFVESEHRLVNGDVIRLGGSTTIEFSCDTETSIANGVDSQATEKEEPVESAPVSSGSLEEKTKPRTIIFGIIAGLGVIAVFAGALFAAGILSSRPEDDTSHKTAFAPPASPSPVNDPSEELPSPTPEVEATEELLPNPPKEKKSSTVEASQAQILAAKISPKNYKFDPAFVQLIGGYVNDYKSAGGYYSRARKYRDAIDKEFLNTQGLPPVFGYVLAMSRTKFVENNGDPWSLSSSIVKGENVGTLVPDSNGGPSTKVAASYIRGLWDVFGKEGFMYVVACYGMSLDEAGEVQQRLEAKDPTGEGRLDFWRMRQLGVVRGEEVERVARFFAAGVVIENPEQYGLSDPPLSTLY
jgi:pSer/pThr/pTyr-binding forkhead associated (FHA) protein